MALIAITALAFAGLRDANETWASAVFTLAVLILAYATLLARVDDGGDRTAWWGFALFGWIYMGVTFGAALLGQRSLPPAPLLMSVDRLEHAQVALAPVLRNEPPPRSFIRQISSGEPAMTVTTYYAAGVPIPNTPAGTKVIDVRSFQAMAHSLGAIGFGLLGGTLGWFVSRPRGPGPSMG